MARWWNRVRYYLFQKKDPDFIVSLLSIKYKKERSKTNVTVTSLYVFLVLCFHTQLNHVVKQKNRTFSEIDSNVK